MTCGYVTYIVFQCPVHQKERQKLGDIQGWKDLVKPILRVEGKDR